MNILNILKLKIYFQTLVIHILKLTREDHQRSCWQYLTNTSRVLLFMIVMSYVVAMNNELDKARVTAPRKCRARANSTD